MDWFIKSYEPSDAASIAQMWNESDEGWPGGFTEGVPFTEERVLHWLAQEHPIDIFLVVTDDRVVAYCSLYEYGMEPTAAYVSLLNCHPRYWQKGFGRELLKKAVARSTELGYKRLDLHTWPGNLRAVPLYKKTGFFWEPETQVHMLNFLPLILPLAPDFFAGADWYTCFQRELAQTEDDVTWRGLKVFPYVFGKDGRVLKVVIDRESRGVTAFENDDFSVACLLQGQDLIAGMSSPLRWEVVNKKRQPLAVSLLATGESGLSVYKRATVDVRERVVIEGEVSVDRDIVAHGKDEPGHKITSTLVVDGRVLVLETGVRPKQAVEINPDPAYVSLPTGLPQTVHLRLKNNLKRPAHATVALMPPTGVAIDQTVHSVDLPAEGCTGITCTMQATQAGTPEILASITAETETGNVSVKPARLPVAAPGTGIPSAYLRPDEVVLENELIRLVVMYKAAQLNLYRKDLNQYLLYQRASLGLPFYPYEFRGTRFSCRLEEEKGAISAILSAASHQRPGVVFERVFTIDSSPIVTIGHRLRNTSSAEYDFEIQTGHRMAPGKTSVALPTKDGLVVDLVPGFPDWTDDESRKPGHLSETWLAAGMADFVVGVMWAGAKEQPVDSWTMPELVLPVPTLPAYGRSEAPLLYLYAGPGGWRDVRRAWRRLVNPAASAADPEPRRALQASATPAPLVLLDGKAEASLHLDNQRNRELTGTVDISLPVGWSVTPAHGEFSGLKRGQPYDIPISLRQARGQSPAIAEARLTMRHALMEEQATLPVLSLGRRGGVELAEYEEQGRRLVSIDNGLMRLVVAPDHLGSVTTLEADGVNHLYSSYPTPRTFSWMSPWHGGVSPALMALDDEDVEVGNPGRLFLETFSYELVRPRRGAAVPWTGVRAISDLRRDCFRGLRLEMDYLTVGRSNVLAIVARLVNQTAAPFSVFFVTQAFVQPGGERDGNVLHDWAGHRLFRLRDHLWGEASGCWAAVSHGEAGQTVALVSGRSSVRGQIAALDYGMEGAHLFNVSTPVLAPHGTSETVSYLVLTPDVAQARLYRWLEHWSWPSL